MRASKEYLNVLFTAARNIVNRKHCHVPRRMSKIVYFLRVFVVF